MTWAALALIVVIAGLWLMTAGDRRNASPEPFRTVGIDCAPGYHPNPEAAEQLCVRDP
jgi:hypothetical protein